MHLRSLLVVAALASPACASPIFVPSSYYASIGSSMMAGPLTPVTSTNDINTPLSTGLPTMTSIWYDTSANARITVYVSGSMFPTRAAAEVRCR